MVDSTFASFELQAAERSMQVPAAPARQQPSERTGTTAAARWRTAALVLAPWVTIVAIWYAVAYSGLINPALLPKPHAVLARFWELMRDRLPLDIWMSTERVFVGVLLGIVAAVPVGFVLGWYRGVRAFIDPVINFFRALPPIALIPLVIVYFGIGEPAKIVILFYASFFAGVIVMYEGIAQISPIYVRVARTLGATDAEIFRKVIVPLTVPHMLTALRVALGVAWATLVASELIAARQGLGALIQNASSFFQLDIIYVGIICIGFIALAMDLALRAIAKRLVSWQERIA
jgi:NitT/TauT family transport system permease protein